MEHGVCYFGNNCSCGSSGILCCFEYVTVQEKFQAERKYLEKVRTLLVPYFIVITFWIVLYAAMQAIPFAQPFFSNNTKLISEWGIFQYLDAYLGLTQSPLVYPLWFAQNLFF